MWAIATDVCLSVCVGHDRKPGKTAEPIEMPFGLLNRVGPGNHALDWGCAMAPSGEYD